MKQLLTCKIKLAFFIQNFKMPDVARNIKSFHHKPLRLCIYKSGFVRASTARSRLQLRRIDIVFSHEKVVPRQYGSLFPATLLSVLLDLSNFKEHFYSDRTTHRGSGPNLLTFSCTTRAVSGRRRSGWIGS